MFPGQDLRKIKPGSFITSSELDNVTSECVRELESADDFESFHFEIIDAASKIKEGERHAKRDQKVLIEIKRQLKSRLPSNIRSQNSGIGLLLTALSHK